MKVHRRSQDFVWGALFYLKNWRPFLVIAFTDDLKLLIEAPTLPRTAKNVLKLILALPGGALAGSVLTNFPCKLRLKCFSPPWGAAPTVHPAYACESQTAHRNVIDVASISATDAEVERIRCSACTAARLRSTDDAVASLSHKHLILSSVVENRGQISRFLPLPCKIRKGVEEMSESRFLGQPMTQPSIYFWWRTAALAARLNIFLRPPLWVNFVPPNSPSWQKRPISNVEMR